MSLAFLAPDRVAVCGAAPLQSPIQWILQAQGARFAPRSGWSIVNSFGSVEREFAACRARAGLLEASCLGKIEVQGGADALDSLGQDAIGAELKLGQAHRARDAWWCRLTPSRLLVLTLPEETPQVRESLEAVARSAATTVSVVEVTSALCSNLLVGPRARETLARLTALDLRPQHFAVRAIAPGSVARTPGTIIRTGENGYLHLFGAAYAAYLWTATRDALRSLGGRCVGWTAVKEMASELGRGGECASS